MASAPVAATRARPGGGRLFIVVGLVMALLAFLLVIVVGNLTGGGNASGGGQVQVIVAADNIAFRTTIAATDLTTKNFVQADVPPGSFLAAQKSSVIGSVAELSIDKGQPLTQNMLAKSASDVVAPTTSYLPLPSGWVAYTMPTSEQQGVAGYPQVGDYITVIASVDLSLFNTGGSSGPPRFVAKTVYTNLRIIRIGPAGATSATGASQQGGLSSSLTVEMTQCDAEFMTWLQAKTTLKYTLESYHDYAPPPTAADSSCPTIAAAQGVGPREVDGRWHFTAIG